jgi:hypothetical protein
MKFSVKMADGTRVPSLGLYCYISLLGVSCLAHTNKNVKKYNFTCCFRVLCVKHDI